MAFAEDAMSEALAEVGRWKHWSSGRYPDTSPGDVIDANWDGTIVLDDGIVTWNPLRALVFLSGRGEGTVVGRSS